MRIEGIFNISNSNPDEFYTSIENTIHELQDDGQEVEIQYSTDVSEYVKGGIVYSALILGRK